MRKLVASFAVVTHTAIAISVAKGEFDGPLGWFVLGATAYVVVAAGTWACRRKEDA